MQTKEQIAKQAYENLRSKQPDRYMEWQELDECDRELIYEAMELYASQQQGGMRWVDCATQLPDTYDMHEKHFRLDGKKVYGILIEAANGGVLFEYKVGNGYCTLEDLSRVQWLDESEASPTSQPAQGEVKNVGVLLSALKAIGALSTDEGAQNVARKALSIYKALPSPEPAQGPCAHDAVIDSGTGYYYCKQCNRAWTIEEWRRGQEPSPEPAQGEEQAKTYEQTKLYIEFLNALCYVLRRIKERCTQTRL